MKLNNVNFGFIILNLDKNYAGLKTTYNSIKNHYTQPAISVVDGSVNSEELKKMKEICECYKSKSLNSTDEFSLASELINLGIKNSKKEWNFIVIAGSWVRPNLKRKFDIFVKDEKDVLYPIIDDRRLEFPEASINGILVNKKAFKEIGEWPTQMWKINNNPLYLSKLFWYAIGLEHSYKFKGIVGMRIC